MKENLIHYQNKITIWCLQWWWLCVASIDSLLPASPHMSVCGMPDREANPLRPRQNGRHFTDDTLNRMFLKENVRISIKISLKFAPKGPINNIPALVQIMAWRQPGDKPLSEPMIVSLRMPEWVKGQILYDGMRRTFSTACILLIFI